MMNYKEIRTMIEEMAKENHEDFVKALIRLYNLDNNIVFILYKVRECL